MKTSLQTNATNEVHGSPSSSLPDDKKVWANLETSPIDESDYAYWERVRMRITGYWASFVLTGIMIPIVSSVILVSLYFSFNDLLMHLPLIGYLDSHSPWNILLLAHLLTIVLWLFTALVCYPFARAQSARPGSYGLLNGYLCQLRAKLDLNGSDYEVRMLERKFEDIKEAIAKIRAQPQPPRDTINNHNQAAMTTALASYIDIRKMLYHTPTGLLWAFGSGYCNAWRLVHQAEEAIIEFDCIEEVIYGAMRDKMALERCAISARDELLNSLIQAVTVLEPTTAMYLKEHQPENLTLSNLKEKAFEELLLSHGIPIQQDNHDSSNKATAHDTARSALRRVKRALNTLQDRGWEGLLRARNRLLATIAITGIVTHVLLCITILTIPSLGSPIIGNSTDPLVAATAFYLVGAVTGLFGRFYKESMTGSSVDDFGFSTARLIATPLLSGLAGIGGVLFLITLTMLEGSILSSSNGQMGLEQIFIIKPQSLLIAAVFGLTPNLLITGLQKTAKKYESEIQSSRQIEASAAD